MTPALWYVAGLLTPVFVLFALYIFGVAWRHFVGDPSCTTSGPCASGKHHLSSRSGWRWTLLRVTHGYEHGCWSNRAPRWRQVLAVVVGERVASIGWKFPPRVDPALRSPTIADPIHAMPEDA